MKPLGFEFERLVKHGERWRHSEKGIFYQMSSSPSGNAWYDDARRQFQKLISSNFDTDELNELLRPLLKKNKVKFNKQGKLRVLRIGGDFETNLIRDLIIPDIDIDGNKMSIHQELQEFSDGKDDDEMDAIYEKVKDISLKGFKKDKRKTKIED